jgi:hypothetical protein
MESFLMGKAVEDILDEIKHVLYCFSYYERKLMRNRI